MNAIADKLRANSCYEDCDGQLLEDAADEIERLEAALKKLWDWQKGQQELLPDGLADEITALIGDK